MMEREHSKAVLAVELRQEILLLIDEVQKYTRQVEHFKRDEKKYPDLYHGARDNLISAEERLGSKIYYVCDLPRNEVYRCLAAERAQSIAMQAAHAQAITQVFSAMADRMEKMRREHRAQIRELEYKAQIRELEVK